MSFFNYYLTIFVNKLDRVGADFLRVVGQVEKILGANPLVMVLPIGIEDDFIGVVDLLTRKSHVWPDPGNPEKFEIGEVPEDMVDLVEEWELFLAFLIVDGCTDGKSTEPLDWFFAEVNERVESRVDSTWIRIVANPDNISES